MYHKMELKAYDGRMFSILRIWYVFVCTMYVDYKIVEIKFYQQTTYRGKHVVSL